MTLQLLSKEEYLSARKEWKDEYADISLNIKVLKKAEKEAASGGYSSARKVQSLRARTSNCAHEMMDELEILKETSRISVQFERFIDQQNSR